MIKPLVRLAVVAGAVASAIWLLPATVAIASWRASGPLRVAFLLPLADLWAALASVLALLAVAAYLWRRRGHPVEQFADLLTPLTLLWLWSAPFVPWLADRAPMLLLFAGPLRWVVAAAAVAGVFTAARHAPVAASRLNNGRSRALSPIDIRLALVVSFAVYTAMGIRYAGQSGFNGDEPHYLIIAQSLIADHDLDIANNHEQKDYAAFFGGTLRPDFLQRGRHGEIYSIHAPGLPALLAPAYRIGGATGAVVCVALLAALASVLILILAGQLAGARIAWATWAIVCFSVPFVPYAWLIYPEAAAALIVAGATLRLFNPPQTVSRTAAYGLWLALLPWLHTKFVIFTVGFALFETVRLWPRVRHVVALIVPIGIVLGLWLLSFYWMYGVFDPQAPYGASSHTLVVAENIPRGLLGLLFDQKFGLIVYSPAYILAGFGAWWLLRTGKERIAAITVIVVVLAFIVSTARFYMWWGGSSAPARFLVPIVPLLAPLIAVALTHADDVLSRAIAALTVTITLGASILALASPGERLLYSDPHGLAAAFAAIQGTAPLDLAWPTFTEQNWSAPFAQLLMWVAAAAAAWGLTVALVRARVFRTAYAAAVSAAVLFVALSGLTAGRLPPAARELASRQGQLDLLQAYDRSRFHAIDATRGKRLDDAAVRLLTTVAAPLADEGSDRSGFVELPQGRYEARVWSPAATGGVGELRVVTPENAVIASFAGSMTSPASMTFDMPLATRVGVRLSVPGVLASVQRAIVVPVDVVPRSWRDAGRARLVEPIGEGAVQGFLAYTDDAAYAEQGVYWTKGTERATTVIGSRSATGVKLILHVGAVASRVEVTAGSQRLDVALNANETREVAVEFDRARSRTLLAVRASQSFVPAEHNPANSDRRRLGCQVRPVLF